MAETAGELSRHQAEWIEGGFNHGQCLRADMQHINTRFANTTSLRVSTTPPIDTRTVEGISFGVRWIFDAFAVHQLWVEIVDGQFSPEELGGASAWWYIDGAELAYWKRINLKWTDFEWGWDNTPNAKPITQIRFNFVLKTNFGGMSSVRQETSTALMDDFNWIPAGQSLMVRETYTEYLAGGGSRYLSNAQINVAPGDSSMEWDEVKLDVPIIDTWEGCVRFTYQWTEQGRVEWRGPMYSGYQCPAVWELAGETEIAAKLMDFLKAAQDEYASRYSVPAGPFMPVWVPISNENPAEYGGTAETWGWNGPDTNTNWAGFQYRALAAAGHYYYLTGSGAAKTVLDNWMSLIDTRILADSSSWKVPSDFVKDSAGYEYNYFSPDLHALIAQAMIFKFWRDGDAIAQVWFRRPLNDLAGRQLSNGLFAQSSGDIYVFHQGEVGKAFGMLLNGRTGGQVNYPLAAEPSDRTAFERLVNGLINARGRVKPCTLDFDDWLPLHHFYDQAQQLSEKIWVGNTCGTSEGIGLCLMIAIDWALYSGDKIWFKKLAGWLNSELGLFVTDY